MTVAGLHVTIHAIQKTAILWWTTLHSSLVILVIVISATGGVEGVEPFDETSLPLLVGQLLEVVPAQEAKGKSETRKLW